MPARRCRELVEGIHRLSRHSGTLPPSGKGLGASAVSQEMVYHPHRQGARGWHFTKVEKLPTVLAWQLWGRPSPQWPGWAAHLDTRALRVAPGLGRKPALSSQQ